MPSNSRLILASPISQGYKITFLDTFFLFYFSLTHSNKMLVFNFVHQLVKPFFNMEGVFFELYRKKQNKRVLTTPI